jgi:hypothetical protein
MKLVFENELCKFYENDVTKSLNEYCVKELTTNLPPLEGFDVLLAEHKSNSAKTYVLYHGNTPVYPAPQPEAIVAHIDMLRLKLKR